MSLTVRLRDFFGESAFLFHLQQRYSTDYYWQLRKVFGSHDIAQASILDLGCGTSGCVHFVWDQRSKSYLGVDLCRNFLKWGKSHYPNTSHVLANVEKLPFRKMNFDFVCIFSLLHHLSDSTIGHLAEKLKELGPEARIFIADPVFPEGGIQTFSDRISAMLLNHDRGNFIRTAEQYPKVLGPSFQVIASYRFKCSMHHFCGFELSVRR